MSVKYGYGLPEKLDNGSIVIFGLSFPSSPKVFTYVMLKAGGLWFVTGSGKVPTAAGWPAIERWLTKDGKRVQWAGIVEHSRQTYRSDEVLDLVTVVDETKNWPVTDKGHLSACALFDGLACTCPDYSPE